MDLLSIISKELHLRYCLNTLCNFLPYFKPQWQFLNIPSVPLSWLDFAVGQSYSLNSFQKLLRGEPVNKTEGTYLKCQNLMWMDENPSLYKMLNFRYSYSLNTMTAMSGFQCWLSINTHLHLLFLNLSLKISVSILTFNEFNFWKGMLFCK